ncbi:transcription factor 7-like [Syngnathoides biaculeatus]|uniref:transcription factor 7-like n=1 Tax=Syngnathoides biaculeatus TaxID=300417 RepID=UPI002ADDA88F|nr:transcription factor 7-like [Syngnathoides biaculeatus]
MERFQTLFTDEDVKWDKLLDNILNSADNILWGTTPARPPPTTAVESEPKESPQPPETDDELSDVLDDFWLPDYLGGPISIQDPDDIVAATTQPPGGRLHVEPVADGARTAASSDSAEPPTDAPQSVRQEGARPYVKKPPNAFMLFRKEQSPNVVARFSITNSAVVNKILGKMWKSLPRKLQAKYYQQAEELKILHGLRHPDWSCTDNYGKKRKRDRRRHGADHKSVAMGAGGTQDRKRGNGWLLTDTTADLAP